jgi:hypothetical protein
MAFAALGNGIIEIADRIPELVAAQIDFRQSQFLALVDQCRTAQGAQQREQHLRQRRITLRPAAETRHGPRHVVIGE